MKRAAGKTIKVAELFAGVGGFRVGFDRVKGQDGRFEVVWSNQWEPATKKQHASDLYVKVFGRENHSCVDIAQVPTKDIPNHDLLVGGFPCQDYSAARTLSHAKGLEGKKGILWWSIHRILKDKDAIGKAPSFLMLENVDRLLKSPAKQRGRDFAVMLASLSDLGYAVEWRVINAADYGMPQKRKRVYILGYKKGTKVYKDMLRDGTVKWLTTSGVHAEAFPIEQVADTSIRSFTLDGDLAEITEKFNPINKFETAGVMIAREVTTFRAIPQYTGPQAKLKDFLETKNIPEEFWIDEASLKVWKKLKGGGKYKRKSKTGFEYSYSEGAMAFPDHLNKPSRTIVTGEGGSTPSRFKHIVKIGNKYRRLMPIELERLNMFPPNHTAGESDTKRAFFMGNALVVGIVTKLGEKLIKKVAQ